MTSNILGWKTTSNFVKAVLRSHWVALIMLASKLIQIPAISYFPGRMETNEIKANSA